MLREKQNTKLPDSDLSIPVRGHGLGGEVGSENGVLIKLLLGRGHPMATQQISGFKRKRFTLSLGSHSLE